MKYSYLILKKILKVGSFLIIWSIFFTVGKYVYTHQTNYVSEWDIFYLESNKKYDHLDRYIKEATKESNHHESQTVTLRSNRN